MHLIFVNPQLKHLMKKRRWEEVEHI